MPCSYPVKLLRDVSFPWLHTLPKAVSHHHTHPSISSSSAPSHLEAFVPQCPPLQLWYQSRVAQPKRTYKASIPAATRPNAPIASYAFIDDAALDVAVAAPDEVAVPVLLDLVAVEVPLAVPEAEDEDTLAQSSVATVRVSSRTVS